jgi:hypothetical protein
VSPAAFAATFRLGLQDTFVYRWNILLRSLVTVVPLLATVALWDAVFASNSQGDSPLAAYGRDGMTLYFIAAMIVHTLVTPTEGASPRRFATDKSAHWSPSRLIISPTASASSFRAASCTPQ